MAHVNRRQWERFAYPAELKLTASGHVVPARLVDLSQRGMQIIVPVKLHLGDVIRAQVLTPRAALAVAGRIRWVAADRTDGTPQTRAGLLLDPLSRADEQQLIALASERTKPRGEARRRRFLQYDAASVLPELAAHSDVEQEALTVPKHRAPIKLGWGLLLGAALWFVTRLFSWDSDAPTATETDRRTSQRVAASATIAPSLASAERTTIKPKPAPPPPALPAPDTTRATDTTPTTGPSAALSRAPLVTTMRDTTQVFVPISGSLAGLEAKLWTDPPAIAVDLPRGTVALPRRRYELQGDGVVGLSIGQPAGVTQLRVYVNSVLVEYEATAAPGGVTIRIKRDLQSPLGSYSRSPAEPLTR